MTLNPRPIGIMSGNEILATGAIMRARESGFSIPDEISITGFDDIDIAEVIQPKTTTVHVPHRHMGEPAAQILLDVHEGKTERKSLAFGTEIIMRGSPGRLSNR